jgi:anti-sigma regulatory factor (Ser/Thr protein kinase)
MACRVEARHRWPRQRVDAERTPMTPLVSDVSMLDSLFASGLLSREPSVNPYLATCPLPPQRGSVKIARDFAERTLGRWGVGEIFDALGLVVSELVTNALVHAFSREMDHDGTDMPSATSDSSAYQIHLGLARDGSYIVCAVTDPSESVPRPRQADGLAEIAENGRGLCLVDAFSSTWGWRPLLDHGRVVGKAVWAAFRVGATVEA